MNEWIVNQWGAAVTESGTVLHFCFKYILYRLWRFKATHSCDGRSFSWSALSRRTPLSSLLLQNSKNDSFLSITVAAVRPSASTWCLSWSHWVCPLLCLSVCLAGSLRFILYSGESGRLVWLRGFCQYCGRCEQRRSRPLSSNTPPSINLLLVAQLHELTSCRPKLFCGTLQNILGTSERIHTHRSTNNCSVAKRELWCSGEKQSKY